MRVAFAAGGGAEAPGGWATLIPQDLIDGGAVLVGQGRRIGRCIAILLGVWERGNREMEGWGGVWGNSGGKMGGGNRREGRKWRIVQGERRENL